MSGLERNRRSKIDFDSDRNEEEKDFNFVQYPKLTVDKEISENGDVYLRLGLDLRICKGKRII